VRDHQPFPGQPALPVQIRQSLGGGPQRPQSCAELPMHGCGLAAGFPQVAPDLAPEDPLDQREHLETLGADRVVAVLPVMLV